MSITVTVENGTIKLPADVHFPDGTRVRVELLDCEARRERVEAWLNRAVGAATKGVTTDEVMKLTRGEP